MLQALKQLLEDGLKQPATGPDSGRGRVELAAAVLMVEISLADSELTADERSVIRKALRQMFHLDEHAVDRLISLAESEVDHAVSLFEFTRLINDALSAEEKVQIVELLWKVAFADAILDKYEEYYIRKIADLLHVPHRQFIRTRHLAGGKR